MIRSSTLAAKLKWNLFLARRLFHSNAVPSGDDYLAVKRLNRKLVALKYLLQDSAIYAMPRWIDFEVTHICNLRCPHCQTHGTDEAHSKYNDRRFDLPKETVETLARETLPSADEFALAVSGEPLIWPHFAEFLHRVSGYHAKLDLVTNATLFTRNRLAALIPVAGRIQISLDGATPLTVESIRLGTKFEKLLYNIRLLTRTIELLPQDMRPKVSFASVIMASNIRELPDLVRLSHRLSVPELSAAFIVVFSDAIRNEAVEFHRPLYNAYFERALGVARELGVRVSLPPPFKGIKADTGGHLGEDHLIVKQSARGHGEAYTSPAGILDSNTLEEEAARIASTIMARKPELHAKPEALSVRSHVATLHRELDAGLAKHDLRLRELKGRPEEKVKYCYYLHKCTYVFPSGEVAPCCAVGRPILGDVRSNSVREIWNGKAYIEFRKRFFSDDPFDCCKGCVHLKHVELRVFLEEIFG